MRNFFLGITLTLVILLAFNYCNTKQNTKSVLIANSALIEKEIKNVGKLVVTEGHFSEVFNYNNSKAIFGDYFTSDKKALVVVNANVTIAYDLSKIKYAINKQTQTLQILSIPNAEVNINPDLEYYDIQSDFLNPFEANDYNAIKESVKVSLLKKIEASPLKSNAKNRLLSELSKFYIITHSLGWTLTYNNTPIISLQSLDTLKF